MSSTRREPSEKELRKFFDDRLVPVAEALRLDGVRLMPLGPGDQEETWYVPYPAGTPEFVEFEGSELGPGLAELWRSLGLTQLVALAGPIGDLAAELEKPTPTEDADVSPFIYVMF